MNRFLLAQAGRSFVEVQHTLYASMRFAQQHWTHGCVALNAVLYALLHELCVFRSMIMAGVVHETNHTYNRFVVGVLFAELMAGILIVTFGEVSSLDASAAGEILHEFRGELEVLPPEEVVFVLAHQRSSAWIPPLVLISQWV